MKITYIMNEKSQSEGSLAFLCCVNSLCNVLIYEVVFVVPTTAEPIVDVVNSFHDAVWVVKEFRVVLKVATLVKVRGVNEMPVILPFLARFF